MGSLHGYKHAATRVPSFVGSSMHKRAGRRKTRSASYRISVTVRQRVCASVRLRALRASAFRQTADDAKEDGADDTHARQHTLTEPAAMEEKRPRKTLITELSTFKHSSGKGGSRRWGWKGRVPRENRDEGGLFSDLYAH